MKKYNIALVGSFDVENYGDLLFENIFSFQIRKMIEVENIDFFAPKNCKKPFENEKQVYSVVELEDKHLKRAYDAIVIGGGDLIHFHKIMTNMPYISKGLVEYEALYMWLIPLFTSIKYNIPLIWNSPGVPFEFDEKEKKCVNKMLDFVDYICVRDEKSRKILLDTGTSQKINVCVDTVLSLREVFEKDSMNDYLKSTLLPIERNDEYIIFHGNANYTDEDIRKCSDVLLKIKNTYRKKIVLLPIGYALGDMEILEKIANYHPDEFILSSEYLSVFQTIALISNAAVYIGSSLHGLITATSYEVPSIVINNYNAIKIAGFLEKIKRDDIMITDIGDLWQKYIEIQNMSFVLDMSYLEEIKKHFENMSKCMGKPVENKCAMSLEIELSDMMSEMNQISLKENHIFNLEKQNKQLSNMLKQALDNETVYKQAINDKENHINNITNDFENQKKVLIDERDVLQKEIKMYKDICDTHLGKFVYKKYMRRKGEK